MIRYLTHPEIDKAKWNNSLESCYNHLVYAHTHYLDVICDSWDALVLNDYEALLPMPVRKKYGVNYIYHPFFCQQLGIFSKFLVSGFLVEKFVNAIPEKFRFIDSQFNSSCSMDEFENGFMHERKNHELTQLQTYEQHWKYFSDNTKRNIIKAGKNNLTIQEDTDVSPLVDFYIQHNGERSPEVKETDYARFKKLIHSPLPAHKYLLTVQGDQKTLATGIFIGWNGRLTYLMGASSDKGKELNAMYFLMDHIIKNILPRYELMDFEGSDIEGIARFYRGFGANEVTYFHYKENRLPLVMRLLKR